MTPEKNIFGTEPEPGIEGTTAQAVEKRAAYADNLKAREIARKAVEEMSVEEKDEAESRNQKDLLEKNRVREIIERGVSELNDDSEPEEPIRKIESPFILENLPTLSVKDDGPETNEAIADAMTDGKKSEMPLSNPSKESPLKISESDQKTLADLQREINEAENGVSGSIRMGKDVDNSSLGWRYYETVLKDHGIDPAEQAVSGLARLKLGVKSLFNRKLREANRNYQESLERYNRANDELIEEKMRLEDPKRYAEYLAKRKTRMAGAAEPDFNRNFGR